MAPPPPPTQPDLPAVSDYPTQGPHDAALVAAHTRFLAELVPGPEWNETGEKEGVKLSKKVMPNPNDMPTVRGTTLVSSCSADQFLAVLSLPGFRKRWDSKFEHGHMMARYSFDTYAFYSIIKGLGWIVGPRDLCGVQKIYRERVTVEGQEVERILILQTSIVDDALAKVQDGKTRANLFIAGWELLPQGKDLLVTYVANVALNGSLPTSIVKVVATDVPLCAGKSRDIYYALGHTPYIHLPSPESSSIVFQRETFSDPNKDHEYMASFTTGTEGDKFEIVWSRKMFEKGIEVKVEAGEAFEAVMRDGEDVVDVKCLKAGVVGVVRILGKK